MEKILNRRDFLISLGTGSLLAIAGFFTFDTVAAAGKEQPLNAPSDKPKLSERIKKEFEDGQMVLCGERAKCSVNRTGERIVDLLDGNRTLPQISAEIADYYSIERTDPLEASVASFICQLGFQGFLAAPFYVTMYETYC
jgi:hypothetical protein